MFLQKDTIFISLPIWEQATASQQKGKKNSKGEGKRLSGKC
jgi:hypothetical protein